MDDTEDTWISAYDAALLWLVAAHLGSLRLGGLHAQDIPRHVRAQVFAADGAAGGPLNEGAALRWDGAKSAPPLLDSGGRNTQHASQRGLPANRVARNLDGVCSAHAANCSIATHQCKAMLHVAIDSIAL